MTDNKAEIFSSPENFHAHLQTIQASESTTTPEPVQQSIPEQSHGIKHDENPNESIPTDNQATESNVADVENVESTESVETAPNKGEYNIPKSRFNQEIEKRKALEAQLTQEREERIRFEAQLKLLQEQNIAKPIQTTQAQEIVPEIDPLDPESHHMYMNKISDLEKKLEQIAQNTTFATQQLNNRATVERQQIEFERSNPDFKDALQHLVNVETRVAQTFFSPEEANKIAANKLEAALVTALNQGKNGAQTMYELAKTYGYTPKTNQDTSKVAGVNLDAIANNMKKSASISSLGNNIAAGGNNTPAGGVSLLADPKNPYSGVDPDKFHRQLAKLKG